MVDREHTWNIAGDSCKSSSGGWSIDLLIWWYHDYPLEIVCRARLPNKKLKGYICINCLETIVVIINLAAAIVACDRNELDTLYSPILLNYCDNTLACAWINKRC